VNAERFALRMRRTARAVEGAGLSALVATPGPDLLYLTGHAPPPLERLTALVVAPGRDPALLVPLLERPAASAAPGADGIEIAAWTDGDDPYVVAARLIPRGRVAVTDQTWAAHLLGLQGAAAGREWVPSAKALPLLRAVKDEDELTALSAAGRAADAAFQDIQQATFAGRSELEVAAQLAEALRRHGHHAVESPLIVGSGPNGASPHHGAGDRVIQEGDVVVLDFGGQLDGYWSDITRTVTVGSPTEEYVGVHDIVRRAQQEAFQAIRPGVAAEEVDRAARSVIADAGYGDRFLHRTGHGIGLELHEAPYIVTGNRTPLEPGMTFSVEPGIYLADRFGVRIEDVVVVTEDGARRLNDAPREPRAVA
jgi:Xaa-Pro aminopeptidase